jgi:hypothetical protein
MQFLKNGGVLPWQQFTKQIYKNTVYTSIQRSSDMYTLQDEANLQRNFSTQFVA